MPVINVQRPLTRTENVSTALGELQQLIGSILGLAVGAQPGGLVGLLTKKLSAQGKSPIGGFVGEPDFDPTAIPGLGQPEFDLNEFLRTLSR